MTSISNVIKGNFQTDDDIINSALEILKNRIVSTSFKFESPEDVKKYCQLNLAQYEHEVFGVLFLNTQNQLIEFKEMFRGTVNQCGVHVREILKEALLLNSAAVILSHNHPSNHCSPSEADINITNIIKDALQQIDIRTLDHIIVTKDDYYSFTENQLI